MLASVYEQQIYQISAKAKRYQSVPLKTPPPRKISTSKRRSKWTQIWLQFGF